MQNIIEDKDRISEKIGEFQKYNQKSINENDNAKSSAFGLAMRITTDLMSGVIIGGVMGWSFDKLFGTSPWLLIVFFILGVAAGISNVIRTANKMNKLGIVMASSDHTGDHHGSGSFPADPMHQFEIKRLLDITIAGFDISFTNSALFMLIAVFIISFTTIISLFEKFNNSLKNAVNC